MRERKILKMRRMLRRLQASEWICRGRMLANPHGRVLEARLAKALSLLVRIATILVSVSTVPGISVFSILRSPPLATQPRKQAILGLTKLWMRRKRRHKKSLAGSWLRQGTLFPSSRLIGDTEMSEMQSATLPYSVGRSDEGSIR